jgi:hypothetical protein
MVEEPSHVKQLSLNHVCKIGLMCKTAYFFIVLPILGEVLYYHPVYTVLTAINVTCF